MDENEPSPKEPVAGSPPPEGQPVTDQPAASQGLRPASVPAPTGRVTSPNPRTEGHQGTAPAGKARRIVTVLDDVIAVFERSFVLLVCVALSGLVVVLGFKALRWHRDQWIAAAEFLNKHWIAAIVAAAPLILRPVLMFLERVEEAFGMKAPIREREAPTISANQGASR